MDLKPGQLVGPYEIVSILGHGGMGSVYLARDPRLDRQVALKFLRADGDDPDADRRLLREARAASALNHPGICQIFDVGGEGAEAWIAMEYVEGQPLSASIPPRGMSPDAVARLIKDLAGALAHAHARGILHRDLKPGNVVCDDTGRPKILDFGIASRAPEAVAQEITRTGTAPISSSLEGSLAYMAPEILRGEAPSERADLWSLGVLGYELLAGTRPFHAAGTLELVAGILEAAVPPLPSHVPPALAHVVARLLAKTPSERFATAGEDRGGTRHAVRPRREGNRPAVVPPWR